MLALGIDTSSDAASVGLADHNRLLAELNLRAGNTHSERLVPAIHALLATAGVHSEQVDVFAVAAGPGSFTGLRIGMATAKGLALGVGRPLAGFSTLETMALAVASGIPSGPGRPGPICVMLDAGRGEVYRGLFDCVDDRVMPRVPESALTPEDAAAGLPEGCILCGSGVVTFRERLRSCLEVSTLWVGNTPFIGSTLARRAIRLASAQGLGALPPLVPNYLRLSDAEIPRKG
jgi:tRNA threonylcarbamoyladenosine biosynthesis protein TsaB